MIDGLYMQDVWMGLIKPFVLGFVIVTIACHVGLRTTGGTQGVGRSTTNAVVAGVGGGDRRRFLRDAASDYSVVSGCQVSERSMSDATTTRTGALDGSEPMTLRQMLDQPGAPVIMFDQV